MYAPAAPLTLRAAPRPDIGQTPPAPARADTGARSGSSPSGLPLPFAVPAPVARIAGCDVVRVATLRSAPAVGAAECVAERKHERRRRNLYIQTEV